MSFDQIRLDRHEGIALLTLHRPDRMNAFTTEMMLEIVAALDECDADDGVRAVIFTGSGEKAYCAGADLGQGAATGLAPTSRRYCRTDKPPARSPPTARSTGRTR
jgi:enoyl-CoA hydratase/carnithine racemase